MDDNESAGSSWLVVLAVAVLLFFGPAVVLAALGG